VIACGWRAGKSDAQPAGRLQQPGRSRHYGSTIEAAAQTGAYVAGASKPALHGLVQQLSQRIAVIFGPAELNLAPTRLPMAPRSNAARRDCNNVSRLDSFDTGKIGLRAGLRDQYQRFG